MNAEGGDDITRVLVIFVVLCPHGVASFELFRDGMVECRNDGRLDVRL